MPKGTLKVSGNNHFSCPNCGIKYVAELHQVGRTGSCKKCGTLMSRPIHLSTMARFIIADITDAKSIPAELQHLAPKLLSVPIQPIILSSDNEYALFAHIERFPQVLAVYEYQTQKELLAGIYEKVIAPAETKAKELQT